MCPHSQFHTRPKPKATPCCFHPGWLEDGNTRRGIWCAWRASQRAYFPFAMIFSLLAMIFRGPFAMIYFHTDNLQCTFAMHKFAMIFLEKSLQIKHCK